MKKILVAAAVMACFGTAGVLDEESYKKYASMLGEEQMQYFKIGRASCRERV